MESESERENERETERENEIQRDRYRLYSLKYRQNAEIRLCREARSRKYMSHVKTMQKSNYIQ